MNNIKSPQISFSKKIGLFLCLWLFSTIIGSFIVGFITLKFGVDSTPALRIATTIQDLVIFILPAIATAMLISRLPATFLSIDKFAKKKHYILTLMTLIVSIPAMNYIIDWNESMQLPESMKGIEEWMRNSENNAAIMVKTMLGQPDIPNLILSILIVGVRAGLSEELFFRGTLQKILLSKPFNAHIAIWITAFIFSAIHMQFYGFIPRLLLGAFFGYLVMWSGSLWLPIVAHAFNNITTVFVTWLYNRGSIDIDPNKFGATTTALDTTIAITSVIATIVMIIYLKKSFSQTSYDGKQNHVQDISL